MVIIDLKPGHFGNYLPLAELLQSPFRMEFSMGSLLLCYYAGADADHCVTH